MNAIDVNFSKSSESNEGDIKSTTIEPPEIPPSVAYKPSEVQGIVSQPPRNYESPKSGGIKIFERDITVEKQEEILFGLPWGNPDDVYDNEQLGGEYC